LTSATTLTGLTPGSYTVSAEAAMGADSIVGIPYIGAVTGSPAAVSAGATASAAVSYTQRAPEGLLWIASPNSIAAYTAAQLRSSGTPTPTIVVNTPKAL